MWKALTNEMNINQYWNWLNMSYKHTWRMHAVLLWSDQRDQLIIGN